MRVSVKISVKAQRVPSIYCIECRRACLTIYSYKKLKGVDQAGNLVSSKSQFHTQAVISEIRGNTHHNSIYPHCRPNACNPWISTL